MANDHFVAQTYLKHFGDSTTGGMLRAYRKDGKAPFPCWPEAVCREWDGDLNPKYLSSPELLGQFRSIFEPHWNEAVEHLKSRNLSVNDKFVISGYFANLLTTPPGTRRLLADMHSKHVTGRLSFDKRMKTKYGGFKNLPVEGIELIEAGELKLETDDDYVKAVVTRGMMDYVITAFNQDWTILHNDTDTLFITSDNPAAVREQGDVQPNIRFLPLTPRLCLSVIFERSIRTKLDPTVLARMIQSRPQGAIRHLRVTASEVRGINRDIARCAEQLVFASQNLPSLAAFVARQGRFRLMADYVEVPSAQQKDTFYQGVITRVGEDGETFSNDLIVERLQAYDNRMGGTPSAT